MGTSRRFVLGVAGLVLLAALLRMWIFLDCYDWIVLREPVLDAEAYHQRALGLLAGTWPGDEPYFFGPGYPSLLSGVYRVFGADVLVARILHAVLGISMIAVLAAIGKRLGGTEVGWLAAGMALLHAPFLAFEQWVLLDTVLAVGAVVTFAWALRMRERGVTPPSAIALGLLWGGLIALRGTSLLYAVPLALVIGSRWRPVGAVLAVIAAAAVIAPFAAHNHATGSRALLGTNLGLNLYVGNHTGASGMFAYPSGWEGSHDLSGRRTASRLAGRALSADETNTFWLTLTQRDVTADPVATAGRAFKKVYLFLQRADIPQNENVAFFVRNVLPARFAVVAWWLLLPLAAYGAWVARTERLTRAVVAAALVPLAVAVVFFVTGRYRLPATPFVILLAARGAWDLVTVRPLSVPRWAAVAVGWVVLLSLPRPFDASEALAREYEHVGLRYQRAGNFRASESQYRRALEIDPTHADAWNNLGALYGVTDRPAAAEEAYRKAIEHESESPVPLRNLAMLLGRQERDAEAADAFRRALVLAPYDLDLRLNLGTALARHGDLDAAIVEYRRVLQEVPDHARARELLLSAEEIRHAMADDPGSEAR